MKASTNPFINASQEIYLRFYWLSYTGNVLQFGHLHVAKCWADTGISTSPLVSLPLHNWNTVLIPVGVFITMDNSSQFVDADTSQMC